MTKARTLADFNTTGVLTSTSNLNAQKLTGNLPALNASALTNLTPANLDDTGTIPSALLADVGGGTVVQAKHYNFDAQTTMNGNGQVHSGVTITPTSASNKILVIISSMIEGAGGVNDYANIDLRRDATNLVQFMNALGYNLNAGVRNTYTLNYLDDPQTTSQLEYDLSHLQTMGSTDYYYKRTNYTLLEIAS